MEKPDVLFTKITSDEIESFKQRFGGDPLGASFAPNPKSASESRSAAQVDVNMQASAAP